MARFALKARWVLPISAPPIEHGVVTIDGERIVAVGTDVQNGISVEDLGDAILLPGFVNAHTHLEFSDLDQPLGHAGDPLPEWIRSVIATRKQQQNTKQTLLAGIAESVAAGVTTIGEISTSPFVVHETNPSPEVISFQEVIGFSAARAESVYADLLQRISNAHSAREVGISPHAPYTVHPDLIERLVELARTEQRPLAMHLAESREELQLLHENSGPFRVLLEERSMWDDSVFAKKRRPLDYLQLLANAPRALVVHGNYLTSEEIEFVAGQPQMSVIYCPRTHAYFRHADYPLDEMLAKGVTVALGTDSRASNPDLSLLAEMRFVHRAHSDISAEHILAMGTTQGANALGLDNEVGSIDAGKLANLTAIACEPTADNPCKSLLHDNQPVARTWIRGRSVYSRSS